MEWTMNMEGGGTLYFREDGAYLYFEANRREEKEGLYKVVIQGIHGSQVLGTMLPSGNHLRLSRMISRQTVGQWGCLPVMKVICEKTYEFPIKQHIKPVYRSNDQLFYEQFQEVEKENQPTLDQKVPKIEETQWEVVEKKEKIEERVETEETVKVDENRWNGGETMTNRPEDVWIPVKEEPENQVSHGIKDPEFQQKLKQYSGVFREDTSVGFSIGIPYDKNKEFPFINLFCLGKLVERKNKQYILFSFSKEGKPIFGEK